MYTFDVLLKIVACLCTSPSIWHCIIGLLQWRDILLPKQVHTAVNIIKYIARLTSAHHLLPICHHFEWQQDDLRICRIFDSQISTLTPSVAPTKSLIIWLWSSLGLHVIKSFGKLIGNRISDNLSLSITLKYCLTLIRIKTDHVVVIHPHFKVI